MFEIKKGKTQFVPVRMINIGGDGQTSIAYTDVTASLLTAENVIVNIGISASMWFEASGSNVFAGMGVYQLQIHSASITTTGSFVYAVSAGPNVPAVKYLGAIRVAEVEKSDIFNRIGPPVSSSISQDIQNLSSSLVLVSGSNSATYLTLSGSIALLSSSLRSEILGVSSSLDTLLRNVSGSIGGGVDRLRLTEEGRWKIDVGANKLYLYKDDATTVWRVYGLTGSDGVPTTTNPYERRPVSG